MRVRYANGPLLSVPEADKGQILRSSPGGDEAVLSGLMKGADEIKDRPAIVDVPVGKGRVAALRRRTPATAGRTTASSACSSAPILALERPRAKEPAAAAEALTLLHAFLRCGQLLQGPHQSVQLRGRGEEVWGDPHALHVRGVDGDGPDPVSLEQGLREVLRLHRATPTLAMAQERRGSDGVLRTIPGRPRTCRPVVLQVAEARFLAARCRCSRGSRSRS